MKIKSLFITIMLCMMTLLCGTFSVSAGDNSGIITTGADDAAIYSSVNTGDTTNILLYVGIAVAALVGLLVVIIIKKKNS